ncbi:MAG: hypothetical protein WD205_03680, partial [Rhodothermales bacterium]
IRPGDAMVHRFMILSSLIVLVLLVGCQADEPEIPPDADGRQDEAAEGRDGATDPSGRPPMAAAPGDVIALTGTLIDTHCYADDHANAGLDHDRPQGFVPDCAILCARSGFPVGLLLDDKRGPDVWILVTAPAVLADYMAQTVRVRGEVRSNGVLIPQRVELQQGDEWTFIL